MRFVPFPQKGLYVLAQNTQQGSRYSSSEDDHLFLTGPPMVCAFFVFVYCSAAIHFFTFRIHTDQTACPNAVVYHLGL